MRQLKFRAWDHATQKFSYFDIRNASGHVPNDIPDNQIQQDTGLCDKNDVLIYEGDIISFRHGEVGEVLWVREYFTYMVKVHHGKQYYSIYLSELMYEAGLKSLIVRGNIFESPELLDNNKKTKYD